jgi:hypothetical protein
VKVGRYLFLSLVIIFSGCISKPAEKSPEHTPSLMISQNSDGEVTLMWESDPDYSYTVLYLDKKSGKWLSLRNGIRVRGTGKSLSVMDRVNPRNSQRRYRLQFDKLNY